MGNKIIIGDMATKKLLDANEVEKALVSVKEWFATDECTAQDKLAQAVVEMCIKEIKKIEPVELGK